MPVYFVRHGESENNALGLFSGSQDISLTKQGEAQAAKAAREIKGLGISLIISSPLSRAVKTASIIADAIGYDKAKIQTDGRIREYDIGVLSGMPWRKVPPEELSKVEGAESLEHFRSRLVDFLSDYKNTDENILVVSHAGAYRMIEATRLGLAASSFHDVDPPPNSSCIKLELGWLSENSSL